VYIYGSYRKNKTGVPFFGPTCIIVHVSKVNQRHVVAKSVQVHCNQCQTVLRSLADLELYDGKFQTEAALTVKAFADDANAMCATQSNNLSDDQFVNDGLLHSVPNLQQSLFKIVNIVYILDWQMGC